MDKVHGNIFLFNPTCEFAIANQSPNWQPNRLLQKMEADLSILPMFFAGKDDFVLVDKMPSQGFIQLLQRTEIEIPGFILKNDAFLYHQFTELPKNRLIPWGWSPAAHQFLQPLKKSCSEEFCNSPVFTWKKEHREITSRRFATGILHQLQSLIKADFILPPELSPKICITRADFENAINQWEKIMVKAPWSSSGRGLQPVTKAPVHVKVWEKLMGIVKDQGFAIAEPLLNKVHDLAFLFELNKGKVEYLGVSHFYTDKKGQYSGNYLNGLPETTDSQIHDFIQFLSPQVTTQIKHAIEASEMAVFYEGVFGVDTLIYRDEKNELKINPCLEINVRQTMGLISLRLEKIIHLSKKGLFQIFYQPGNTFYQFKLEMEKSYPLKISDNKITSGFLALTDAQKDSLFGAYVIV